jgi:putative phage-type endonuclease
MHSVDQRSAEWFQCRLGKATASKIADIVAKTKSGYSASRAKYAAQLVCERLTGVPTETFCSPAMQRGTDMEAAARDAYRQHSLNEVHECGFADHPTIAMSGASPDGLVDADGLVEIKCPDPHTHIDTLLNRAIPGRYVTQIQWQLACTGRKWCDFASFDDRLPETMQLFVARLHRDDALIAELEAEVTAFLAEVEGTVTQLRARYEGNLSDQLTQSLEAA